MMWHFNPLVWLLGLASICSAEYTPKLHTKQFNSVDNILYLDDSPVILLQDSRHLFQSNDRGFNWEEVKLEIPEDTEDMKIQQIDIDNKYAFAFTSSKTQYYTVDQGKSWQHFDIKESVQIYNGYAQMNYADHKQILMEFVTCNDEQQNGHLVSLCHSSYYYSKDGLKTPPSRIDVNNLTQCTFAKTNKYAKPWNDNAILCIRREEDSFGLLQASEIVASKDWFSTVLVAKNEQLEKSNVLQISVQSSFMVAAVTQDMYTDNGAIDIYVSKDGKTFKKAFLEASIRPWSFGMLPSSPNSLHIAVSGPSGSRADFSSADVYRSDSQGLYFKKIFGNDHASILGLESFNKIQGIDGSWIASTNTGFDEETQMPLIGSHITLDDGNSWTRLKYIDSDKCDESANCTINLLWTTEQSGNGQAVTGPTPGILMGIGTRLNRVPSEFGRLNTYISRDGGISWRKAADRPSIFSFADFGNIIVDVPVEVSGTKMDAEGATDSFSFSLNQGKSWQKMKLPGSGKFMPVFLVTAKDGTAHQMVLALYDTRAKNFQVVTIDFSSAFKGKCKDKDLETWYSRQLPGSDPVCVYGHTDSFQRRKQDALCFASELYKDIDVIETPCECSAEDLECNDGFSRDSKGKCQAIPEVMAREVCKGKNSLRKVKLTSTRTIPGNPCKGKQKVAKNDYVVDCSKISDVVRDRSIRVQDSNFTQNIASYLYLERDKANKGIPDETMLMTTDDHEIYVSYDGGGSFSQPLGLVDAQTNVASVFTNPYFPNDVYVITNEGRVYYSYDRASTFDSFKTPYESFGPDIRYDMSFSRTSNSTFIWYALAGCDTWMNCHSKAAITKDRGKSFVHMADNVRQCQFASSVFDSKNYDIKENMIICEQKDGTNPYANLISSTDEFSTDKNVILKKVIGSTSSGEFLIAACLNDDNSLNAYTSVDGHHFAEVKFPQDIEVTRQTAYTVLNVNSKQVFMHVTTNPASGHQYGALLKGNYNGTMYVTSIRHVNRNDQAFCDFESVQGLEGISLLNVVDNYKDVVSKNADKQLRSLITYNDGASWSGISAPNKDSNGKKYKCKGCNLQLHSYTDRVDPIRDTLSSGSALGMMFGLGNVGKTLKSLDDDDTALFFTRDAGNSWKEIRKGQYMWEYGDQGTVLVIVKSDEKTDSVSYSIDEGETWQDYKFNWKKVAVQDLATVPSDTARRFMIIAKDDEGSDQVFMLDFTRIQDRQCALDLNNKAENADYEYWAPQHPGSKDKCLFGHEVMYLRRKPKVADCFIGAAPLGKGYKKVRTCECTREDFECDYNFELSSDGTCKLIKGLSSLDNSKICKLRDDVLEYWEPTGYRKIPLSTCNGGLELDKWNSHPCPGKEKDYRRKHDLSIHGPSLFFVIFIPLVAFIASAAFVYDRGIRRNGGFQRFGEIRLDDDDNLHLVEENNTDRVVNKIVMAGVYTVSFVTAAIHKLGTFFNRRFGHRNEPNSVSSMFNDRIVDNDEDSLFRYADDDDDAREIDSFLDNGIENSVASGEEENEDDSTEDTH